MRVRIRTMAKNSKMARHGNKIKLTLLVEPMTNEILKQMKKNSHVGVGVIIDKLVVENCKNREYALKSKKRETIKELAAIEEELEAIRGDKQLKKELEVLEQIQ